MLKDVFSRIFALAINKCGKVKDFGVRSNNEWHWEIPLRRSLFGWELQQWSDFISLLMEYVVYDFFKDSLCGKPLLVGNIRSISIANLCFV